MSTNREGLAQFECEDNVFYNPAMATNRDISIAAIDTFGLECYERTKRKISVFEALSASGIRTCRYANELSPAIIDFIHANDIDKNACNQIKANLKLNGIPLSKVAISNGDCNTILEHHALSEEERFDVIDVDPYGSAAPFLNSSFRAIKDGGLLAVTCTDLAILCGNCSHACIRKYNAVPIHDKIQHEHAIRMILYRMANVSTLNGCAFEPLLSMYCDYYIRIFVKVIRNNDKANRMSLNIADTYYCHKCAIFKTCKIVNRDKHSKALKINANGVTESCLKCILCGSNNKKCGPIWSGPLHNQEFIAKIMENLEKNFSYFPTFNRLNSKLKIIERECRLNDFPYFINHNYISNKFACPQIRNCLFRSVIENAGYEWSLSHCSADSTKTDAPMEFILDALRHYLAEHGDERRIKNNEIAQKLLSSPARTDKKIDFSITKRARDANKEKLYKEAPKRFGPKKAATRQKNNRYHQQNDDDDGDIFMMITNGADDKNGDDELRFNHRRNGTRNRERGRGRGRDRDRGRGGWRRGRGRGRGRGDRCRNVNEKNSYSDGGICRFWQNGYCRFENCKFKHPPRNGAQQTKKEQKDSPKIEIV